MDGRKIKVVKFLEKILEDDTHPSPITIHDDGKYFFVDDWFPIKEVQKRFDSIIEKERVKK